MANRPRSPIFRCWRRRIARVLLFIGITFLLTAASVATQHDLLVQVDAITRPHKFDFVDWISLSLLNELQRRSDPVPVPDDNAGQVQLVEQYLAQETQIRRLQHQIEGAYAHNQPAGQLEASLATLKAEQVEVLPQVETIIAGQIESVLDQEGFQLGGYVFPPLAFRLVEPPTGLIISPRDRIERQNFIGLAPGLDIAERARIEDQLNERGDVAAYITDIGGLGSYPTMVVHFDQISWLIETAVHEWVHNYFYTFPTNIAWASGRDPQLTTINETAASLVGAEVGRKVIKRYYPNRRGQLSPLDQNGQPALQSPSDFDLAMRRIRQQVDELLAQGEIEAAEAYMEQERQQLVAQGHSLRRLNQAYFAFHGSYALDPGSIDPAGPQLRQLRAASGSLKTFLDRVGWLNSSEDYRAWLQEARPAE